MTEDIPLNDHVPFQVFKLLLENITLWQVMALGLLFWALSKKDRLQFFGDWLTSTLKSIKFGSFEAEFKEEKQANTELLAESESQAEYENAELSGLIAEMDPNASSSSLADARERLKQISRQTVGRQQILDGLAENAPATDFYASAEILRQKRDLDYFDEVTAAVSRIARSANLEGKRFMFVWALASALHRMTLEAVKNHDVPTLSSTQLQAAMEAAKLLHDNAHVQQDRPDNPSRGIRGPAKYTINWAEKGLAKRALAA